MYDVVDRLFDEEEFPAPLQSQADQLVYYVASQSGARHVYGALSSLRAIHFCLPRFMWETCCLQ